MNAISPECVTDNGYEIRVLSGHLIVNGSIAEDFLDCLDGSYVVATDAPITADVIRLVRLAFERGAEAQRATRDEENGRA